MPLVTIICPTFMHENFIADALESFVKQRAKFKFIALVCDDNSTDRTGEIVEEYAQKYPDIIKRIHKEGNVNNYLNLLSLVRTKYAIVCEGDDYFTNPYKLQKQVNFLEANPDFSISFHGVRVLYEDEPDRAEVFPSAEKIFYKKELDLMDLLCYNFIQTNSCMFRWRYNEENSVVSEFTFGPGRYILPCDYWLNLLHAEVGKIGFIPEVMAVYRRHAGGVWTGANESDKWFINCGMPHVRFWEEAKKRFGHGKEKALDKLLFDIRAAAVRADKQNLVKEVDAKIEERKKDKI